MPPQGLALSQDLHRTTPSTTLFRESFFRHNMPLVTEAPFQDVPPPPPPSSGILQSFGLEAMSDPGADTAVEADESRGSDIASTVSWAVSSDGFSTDVSESRLLQKCMLPQCASQSVSTSLFLACVFAAGIRHTTLHSFYTCNFLTHKWPYSQPPRPKECRGRPAKPPVFQVQMTLSYNMHVWPWSVATSDTSNFGARHTVHSVLQLYCEEHTLD